MSKKSLISLFILISCFFVLLFPFSNSLKAAHNDLETLVSEKVEFIKPGMLPDSVWHWLDVFGEEIRYIFTLGSKNKAEYRLKISEERLAEYRQLIQDNTSKNLEKTLSSHEKNLQKADELFKKAGVTTKDLAKKWQDDLENELIKNELTWKQKLLKLPSQAKEKLDGGIAWIKVQFKKILNHLSDKKGQLEEKKKDLQG